MEITMTNILRVGLAALAIAGAPCLARAEGPTMGPGPDRPSAIELQTLTDARLAMIKAALQLTPDQEKLWPALEEAIRARAAGRQARLANIEARIQDLRDRDAADLVIHRDPVEFLRRRADALTQRAAELRRLADAWQPLYQTLTTEQKTRLGLVAVFAFRELRDRIEERRLHDDEMDDEE
jgi:hypothetical protein